MRKYAGLSLALVMGISALTGYGLSRAANGASLDNGGNDAALGSLDSSLAAKLRDYLKIIDQIQKLSEAETAASTPAHKNVLSGSEAAPPVAMPAKPRVIHKVKQQNQPWWSGYELNMVFYSSSSKTAVVNGKFLHEGDTFGSGVTVKQIDKDSVTLEHEAAQGKSSANEDNLKTLHIKPGN